MNQLQLLLGVILDRILTLVLSGQATAHDALAFTAKFHAYLFWNPMTDMKDMILP